MAKPDNREDNVEHLQDAVQDTIENFREAEDYLEEFGDEIPAEEKEQIEERNTRRRESIAGFREEIKDEARHQRDQ
ncbi:MULTISPECIES: small acid-soluble spore protein Tlp [Paenibacillus]|uniref:Small acid-soluble spore protein Tlp n=1 Tax=Paenibacillus campinasensis TaxID=66347 RepID=A0A268F254_9BACL|nr:small acid-soluble spore protein Tlp [Paenibacillus campinasensis]PAD79439.1 small acid-soluble spore protein Tlp [Paenibacillus campinasensis]